MIKKEIKPWLVANPKMSEVTWVELNEKSIPLGAIGFIYEIIAIDGIHKGKRYIGKKNLYSTVTRKIPLKEQKLQTGSGRKKLKEKITKESTWREYFGSNLTLKELVKKNPEHFERHILQWSNTPKKLTYLEAKALFSNSALERNDFFNDNILSKFFRKDVL